MQDTNILSSKRRYSFRPFYITILLISTLALLGYIRNLDFWQHGANLKFTKTQVSRGVDIVKHVTGSKCRGVHFSKDKCAFIKANCADEEVGVFSYLSLYFCSFPNVPLFAFLILVLWLGMLFSTIGIAASDFFCINLSTISKLLGMTESLAGVTFLAFGNGSPDVFSTFAAMSTNSGSLAIGELIGAAGFITAVVAGSMALVREFKVGRRAFIRDVGCFVIAAGFSLAFLADGKLDLWECCLMIGFYISYVIIVITSHWYLRRSRKQKERNALARGNYINPDSLDIDVQENPDEDDDVSFGERHSLTRDSFGTSERGTSSELYEDENEAGSEQARAIAAEVSNSMRLTRRSSSRRDTNPIRRSLVGALEFRSVLSSLEKSSPANPHIHLRSYSDDAVPSPSQLVGPSSIAMPLNFTRDDRLEHDDHLQRSGSLEAQGDSANDAPRSTRSGPAAFFGTDIPKISILGATPKFSPVGPILSPGSEPALVAGSSSQNDAMAASTLAPSVSLSPPSSERNLSPPPELLGHDQESPLPENGTVDARHLRADYLPPQLHSSGSSTASTRSRSSSQLQILIRRPSPTRGASPSSPFPRYTDSPVSLSNNTSRAPSLMLSRRSSLSALSLLQTTPNRNERKRYRWWPYNLLPCPEVILSTLFPTLRTWREKPIWDKVISIISSPSIFLLVITLPVVEPESSDESERQGVQKLHNHASRGKSNSLSRLTSGGLSSNDNAGPKILHRRHMSQAGQMQIPQPSVIIEPNVQNSVVEAVLGNQNQTQPSPTARKEPHAQALDNPSGRPLGLVSKWNRWLVGIQIFTAPLFIVLILWVSSSDDQFNVRYLLHLVLFSALGSLIMLSILLLTTSPDRMPKYRFLLCFLGFVVSVTWISTIANEVVGVLKTLGVILDISDAILGLTVFAVGNSLGDLVADITIAKLGYPVMALSACFGGPMLNILLGIGGSGLYMLIKRSDRRLEKHPGQPRKFKPYEIQINRTLAISGIALLLTLVGLLVVVPLNQWVMNRRIGWGLILLWSISTVINLVVELTGV